LIFQKLRLGEKIIWTLIIDIGYETVCKNGQAF